MNHEHELKLLLDSFDLAFSFLGEEEKKIVKSVYLRTFEDEDKKGPEINTHSDNARQIQRWADVEAVVALEDGPMQIVISNLEKVSCPSAIRLRAKGLNELLQTGIKTSSYSIGFRRLSLY